MEEDRPVQLRMQLPEKVVALLYAERLPAEEDWTVRLALVSQTLPLNASDGRRSGLSELRVVSCNPEYWLHSYSGTSGCAFTVEDEVIVYTEPGLECLVGHLAHRYRLSGPINEAVWVVLGDGEMAVGEGAGLIDCNTALLTLWGLI